MSGTIDEILRREGGAVSTDDPADKGGRTQYGIAEASNPDAWKDGKVTEEEARAIYERKYLLGPGFDKILFTPLRDQLVDFGVTSGPHLAIINLQTLLGVEPDGVLGPHTLSHIPQDARRVNNELIASRIRMIGRLCQKNPSQLKFLSGWLNRALEFLV